MCNFTAMHAVPPCELVGPATNGPSTIRGVSIALELFLLHKLIASFVSLCNPTRAITCVSVSDWTYVVACRLRDVAFFIKRMYSCMFHIFVYPAVILMVLMLHVL